MATSIPSTCDAVNTTFVQESGRFGPGLYIRSARKQPIIGLMAQNRGVWPHAMGTTLTANTMERALPTTVDDNWTNIGSSDGADANACLPPVDDVTFGTTSRTYQPKHYAIESNDFCIKDVTDSASFADMLRSVNQHLAELTAWTWFRRYTLDYVTNAGNHWSMNLGGVVNNGTTYSVSALPNAAIDIGLLETIHNELDREALEGAGGMYDVDTGGSVFPLLLGREAIINLLRNNAQLRDDMRYAYMATKENSPLLPGPQKFRNFGGFRIMEVPYPRRFTFTGGAFVEVPVWSSTATTKNNRIEINSSWKTATYEEGIVYHPDNIQSLAVNNVTNPAPGWTFDHVNYMGDFRWVNEYHRTCNPDKTIGFWRAVFAHASKPLNPAAGHTFLYKRCDIPTDLATCSYT